MNRTTAISLRIGDVILDDDGLEMRILDIRRAGRTRTLTVTYVEAATMACRPADRIELTMGVNRMVCVPDR